MIGLEFLLHGGSPILFFLAVFVVWKIGKAAVENEKMEGEQPLSD